MKLAIAVAAAMVAVCAQAEAAVYTFTPTLIGASSNYTTSDATFSLSLTNAIVQSGSFTYDFSYTYPNSGSPPETPAMFVATGDVQSLLVFQDRVGGFAGGGGPQTTSSDYFHVSLQFTPAGQINAGLVAYSDDRYGINIAGSNGLFAGNFVVGSFAASDSVTGQFLISSVPEPTTSLLLTGSVAVLGLRRRFAQSAVAMSNAE